jgi:acetyl esterase/lipase
VNKIISEADQKILDSYTGMIKASTQEAASHPQSPEQGLADYRTMMLRINPYKYPPGFKSKPVASFEPKAKLRDGLTAAISIPLGKGPFPIMVHSHGHGLRAGSPPEYEPWIREMSSYGFIVIFPDYRWQPEHSYADQVDDFMFAINWAYENTATLKGDHEKLIVSGDSAGGALAFDCLLRNLSDPNGHRFRAFASVDGAIAGNPGSSGDLLAKVTAELPLPPVFMVVGSADGLSNSAIKAAARFLELKKNYELSVFYGMPHDFEKFPQLESMRESNRLLMEFLKKTVA